MANIVKSIVDATGMGGYVTWISIAAAILKALVDFYNGDVDSATSMLTYAVGAWGIGRKVEKTTITNSKESLP